MGIDIMLTRGVLARLLAEAEGAFPQEACGLLLGAGGAISQAQPAPNVAPEPLRHFEIDPAALIAAQRAARQGGPQVLGYYHSHPGGLARPSATDRAMASGDGRVWAIVAGGEVTFWRDGDTAFEPLPYRVAES